MNAPPGVIRWLLETENPSVRYRTMTELLFLPTDHPEAQQARADISTSGPVQSIRSRMHPDGYWLHRGRGAGVDYARNSSTHFVLAYLAELGLDGMDDWVARAAERYLALLGPDELDSEPGEVPPDARTRQSCLYAQNIRTFILLGYRRHPGVQKRVEVLLSDWRHDGGYLCDRPGFAPETKSCFRGAVKALAAFAELPELWESERCRALVNYFLGRQVIYKSRRPGVLVREEAAQSAFPFVISASLLEPLYALSRMGYRDHPALQAAWEQLEQKRDAQGRYLLDRSPQKVFDAGPVGQPNKWATFYAYRALSANN